MQVERKNSKNLYQRIDEREQIRTNHSDSAESCIFTRKPVYHNALGSRDLMLMTGEKDVQSAAGKLFYIKNKSHK